MDKISGFLEVGHNEQGEVVINHPDLKPDENGVGHIVFSPGQARNLARLLLERASEAEADERKRREAEQRKAAESIPVDRSARQLSDGSPVPADDSHTELGPGGQQKGYVVLSPAERAKGFVRPLRRSYRHVGVRPKYLLRDLTEKEKQMYAQCDYVKFEAYSESESPITGRFWTQAQLSSGCDTVTTMGVAIAETYARDPKFYGGTFCCTCGKHFPLEEFVWEGTNEQVGS